MHAERDLRGHLGSASARLADDAQLRRAVPQGRRRRQRAEQLPSLSSQYALTSQYHDAGGRARYNASAYGGGCVDFGQPGGSSCKFASAVATGPGHNDIGSDCPVSGINYFWQDPSGAWGTNANAYCITDDQIRTEVSQMVSDMGLIGRTQSGYTPLIVAADTARRRRLPGHRRQDLLGQRRLRRPVLLLPRTSERRRHLGVATSSSRGPRQTPCDDPGVPAWNRRRVHGRVRDRGRRAIGQSAQPGTTRRDHEPRLSTPGTRSTAPRSMTTAASGSQALLIRYGRRERPEPLLASARVQQRRRDRQRSERTEMRSARRPRSRRSSCRAPSTQVTSSRSTAP